jgi:hypothetical protein
MSPLLAAKIHVAHCILSKALQYGIDSHPDRGAEVCAILHPWQQALGYRPAPLARAINAANSFASRTARDGAGWFALFIGQLTDSE